MSYIEFNNAIVDSNNTHYDLLKYVHKINRLSKDPINISFMEDLIKYIDQDACIIPHDLLIKYGVIDKYNSSVVIRDLLNQDVYKFVENKDFELAGFREIKFYGGVIRERNYLLHPRTFKLLLMSSNKTMRYARYYLLLEEAVKYYNEYVNLCKNSKIEHLTKKIEEQSKQIEEQSKQMEQMMQDIKEIFYSLKEDHYNIIKPSKSW
jgi:hypothetical protein